ncbi:Aste57867_22382 [Aphanomyces stellatus]|uniref:Aste57867_22382 protein n=1 Tax=Aphanomyces stellatus TaxID=120398 RepID=A0A485LKT0_9STRA|nr:hypothetical protein As57867_022312 [Aphanomyces stellatus]VFT99045.1 Aste57867_22382 [Aphanomyces stellatus]
MNHEAERRKHETETESAEMERKKILDEIVRIPTLFPWTRIDIGDTGLCHEHNTAWNQPLREELVKEIAKIYVRLMKQMDVLNAHSIIHNAANLTRLQGQLLVEVNRRVDVPVILERVRVSWRNKDARYDDRSVQVKLTTRAERAAASPPTTLEASAMRRKHTSAVLALAHGGGMSPSKPTAPSVVAAGGPSVAATATAVVLTLSPKKQQHNQAATIHVRPRHLLLSQHAHTARSIEIPSPATMFKARHDNRRRTLESQPPLTVSLPRNPVTLRELLEEDARNEAPSVTHFRDRPILAEAMLDITKPLPKRDVDTRPRLARATTHWSVIVTHLVAKARYLVRENCTALPHQHTIFDDYVVPREVWDAVEAEQSLHALRADGPRLDYDPLSLDDINVACYFARACPHERDTLSSALHAMSVRPEKPMVRSVTDMVLDSQFHEKNNTLLLREVKTLYAATNEAYHEFRHALHKPMKVGELVDMAVKCALNDMAMTMDDAVVSTESMVQIPPHLVPQTTLRRNAGAGGAAKPVVLASGKGTLRPMGRRELMEQMHDFEADKKLLALWKQRDVGATDPKPFEPIALDAPLSVKFENVWRGLLVPTTLRLDLALKYSHPENAHRLIDAVTLWEVAAIWIQEREAIVEQVKRLLKGGDPTRMALLDVKEKLVLLNDATKKVKQSVKLTHEEVGDFVTYEDEFYLQRIHAQHRKLHEDLMALSAWREMD